MKRIINMLVVAILITVPTMYLNYCHATDVWVTHVKDKNYDIYVMDDTLRSGDRQKYGGKYFLVSTKIVKDGKLKEIVNWDYDKYAADDMWKVKNNGGEMTHPRPFMSCFVRDALFEFCMNRLGWSYKIINKMYY